MVSLDILVSLVPILPLAGFLVIGLNVKRLPHGAAAILGCLSILASFVISIILFLQLISQPEDQRVIQVMLFDWISAGSFTSSISFLIDPLSMVMLLVITGVGFLIHVYSIGYMHDDEGFNRFFSYLNLFVFFMLILVMGSNYLLMFVGWEGVGLCSYLLIGFWFKNRDYMDAANKAFIMNRIGDLGLILGVILIFIQYGSIHYADVFEQAAANGTGSAVLTTITLLLFVGAVGKSAQIPLYTWLPDAMAGPTPVSALIHAATMVTAGVYMVARNNILYTLSPVSLFVVLIIGLATAIFAATIALVQNDIKKVLAYSTVSQLGLMFTALGVGAFGTGIFHMATHAFFKALLFLAAGSVIHGLHHEQDIRRMGGLRKYMPVTFLTFLTGVIAISGIPPFAGFFSKDEIISKTFESYPAAGILAIVASLLTAFYMFRLLFLTFFSQPRMTTEKAGQIHESPATITLPLIGLAVLSAIGGFMGVPELLGGSNRIGEFLAPVFAWSSHIDQTEALDHGTEYGLMATVVALTLVVIGIAYWIYLVKKRVPVEEGASLSPMHKLTYHKYYIDEIYQAVIVRPLYSLSEMFFDTIERSGIDRLVNAVPNQVRKTADGLRLIQTGNIGFYIFVMVISIIVLMAATVWIN